ncbi:MAG: hypothetical protein P4L99_04965 [Chthoniobacter sp.]|nr:hypothetical protein [Chthoniobacter sp.]
MENHRAAILHQISEARRYEDMAMQAEISGETEEVAMLQREAAVRREAVTIMRQLNVEEEQGITMARARIVAEEKIAALDAQRVAIQQESLAFEREQIAAQAALNAELVREEALRQSNEASAAKVFGRGGQAGNLARNFGADANMAASIGLGLFAGAEVSSIIDGVIKKTEQERIALQQVSDELSKQVEGFRQLASAASNPGDVAKLTDGMASSMDGLQQKLDSIQLIPEGNIARAKADLGAFLSWLDEQRDKLTGQKPDEGVEAIRDEQAKAYLPDGVKQQDALQKQVDQQKQFYAVLLKDAKEHAKEMAAIRDLPDQDQVAAYSSLIAKQKAIQDANKGDSFAEQNAWAKAQEQIDGYQRAIDKLIVTQERERQEAERLKESFDQAEERGMNPEDKLAAINKRAGELQNHAQSLADKQIDSPAAAMKEAEKSTGDLRVQLEQTALAWQKLNDAAKTTRDEIAKEDVEYEKLTAEQDAEAAKVEEQRARHEEILKELQAQRDMLHALVDGDTTRAKQLKDQLDYVREIERLKREGLTDAEAEAEAKKTRELRDQLALKEVAAKADEQAAKVRKIDDEDAVDHAKAMGNQRAIDRAERQRAEDEHRQRLEGAGLSGKDLEDRLGGEMKDYDRSHRGNRIDGRAPQARVKDGLDDNRHLDSAPLDPNDSLRAGDQGPSKDFMSLVGGPKAPGALQTPSMVNPKDMQDLENHRQLAPAPTPHADGGGKAGDKGGGDKGAAEIKDAAKDIKKGGEDTKTGGSDVKQGGSEIKTAIGTFKETVDDLKKYIASLPKGGSGGSGGGGTGIPTDTSSYASDYGS